jgi:signal peptidase II
MSKYSEVFGVAAVVLALDQLSKWYVRQSVALYESIPVIDSLFHITHVRNRGGAFSLFAGTNDAVRIPFFLGVSVIAILVLVYMVRRVDSGQVFLLFALGCILGGALGNFVDRALAGEVTDFLDLHWRSYYWPAFNVADSAISIGIVILVFHSLLGDSNEQQRQG